MVMRRRRGTAKPRWGWSGVAPLPQLSSTEIDLETLLPGHQNPIEQIALALCDLGGRYHRYLHQVELGPTEPSGCAGTGSAMPATKGNTNLSIVFSWVPKAAPTIKPFN